MVSVHSQQFVSATPVIQVTLFATPVLQSLHPAAVTFEGGVEVLVQGSGFTDSRRLSCLWSGPSSEWLALNTSSVLCE